MNRTCKVTMTDGSVIRGREHGRESVFFDVARAAGCKIGDLRFSTPVGLGPQAVGEIRHRDHVIASWYRVG